MNTLRALLSLIVHAFHVCDNDLADSIKDKDVPSIILNLGLIGLMILGIILAVIALIYLAFKFWWLLFIVFLVVEGIFVLVNKGGPNSESNSGTDEVEKTLIIERATEQQDEMRALAFSAIQGASTTTPLARPYNEYDIQPSKDSGKCFYLYQDGIPVYQWEANLESEIDKAQEDIIQRELQRYIVKNLPRFPTLLSEEARGRAAVEVLDVKNLGGHVLIEMVLVNSTSIHLVDARRRARAEQKVKRERINDPRYQ